MATWSSYRAPLNNVPDNDFAIYGADDKMYWVSVSGSQTNLVEYDTVGDTETLIYNEVVHGSEFLWDFTLFKSEVYIVVSEDATGDPVVCKYDGTPDNWTQVQKLRTGRTPGTYAQIYSNDIYIAALHIDYNTTYTTAGYHSVDGSSWSVSSFATTPIRANNIYPFLFQRNVYGTRPIICAFCTANTGAPDRDCTNTNLMQFNGSGWADLISGISDNSEASLIVSPTYNQCWTRSLDAVSGLYTERTDDTFSSPDVPDSQIQPAITINYNKQFGVASGTVSSEIYVWDSFGDSDWTLYDTISDGINVSSTDLSPILVRDDLEAFILFYNLDNFQYEIWTRDEPIPANNAKLYFGQGTLNEVADLPFARVSPQAFALRESLGTLVIGSKSPDSEMVVYAENPYTSVIESDTGIPTGTSVSAIRWI